MNDSSHRSVMQSAALMLGLAGIIAVHIMDLPGKMQEVPYIGFMYIAVILAAGLLVHRVMTGPTRRDFLGASALAGAVIIGYIVNRAIGMPGATGDIGNWWEPLGFLSIVVEAWVVVLGLTAARAASLSTSTSTPTRATVGISSS